MRSRAERVSAVVPAIALAACGMAACGTTVDSPRGTSAHGVSSSATTGVSSSAATTDVSSSPATTTEDEVVEEHGDEWDDFSDPQTWSKWASYVVAVHVDSEEELPLQTITGTTEAPIVFDDVHRDLTVTVEEVVWVHPGALLTLDEGESQVLPFVSGWLVQDDRRVPVKPQESDRMEVGQRYVVVLADTVDDNGAQALGTLRSYRLDGTRIASEEAPAGLVTTDAIPQLLEEPTDERLFPVPGESLGARIVRTHEGFFG